MIMQNKEAEIEKEKLVGKLEYPAFSLDANPPKEPYLPSVVEVISIPLEQGFALSTVTEDYGFSGTGIGTEGYGFSGTRIGAEGYGFSGTGIGAEGYGLSGAGTGAEGYGSVPGGSGMEGYGSISF